MKTILLLFGLINIGLTVSPHAFATTVILKSPCRNETILKTSVAKTPTTSNAGSATLQVFNAHQILFQGNEMGIHSIFNTPVGDAAIEVLSDTEMKVHGWCYQVNGLMPDKLPHLIFLEGSETITWFYGHAHFKNNTWISYCDVNDLLTSKEYCGSYP